MHRCDHPGCEGSDALPFTCKSCGGQFCGKHRLPEAHACPFAGMQGPARGWDAYKQASSRLGDGWGRPSRAGPRLPVHRARAIKAIILVATVLGAGGTYWALDWNFNFTGPRNRHEQHENVSLAMYNSTALFTISLPGFRERADIRIDSDIPIYVYVLDGENYEKFEYCLISFTCPDFDVLAYEEYTTRATFVLIQPRWDCAGETCTKYHVLIAGPDFGNASVQVHLVTHTW